MLEEIPFTDLVGLQADPPQADDIMWCGKVQHYDEKYDSVTTSVGGSNLAKQIITFYGAHLRCRYLGWNFWAWMIEEERSKTGWYFQVSWVLSFNHVL